MAERAGRRPVRIASPARRIGGVDFRAQGCAEHFFLDADGLGLCVRYVEEGRNPDHRDTEAQRGRPFSARSRLYLLSLLCFALGLMSKQMLVTLLCVRIASS